MQVNRHSIHYLDFDRRGDTVTKVNIHVGVLKQTI